MEKFVKPLVTWTPAQLAEHAILLDEQLNGIIETRRLANLAARDRNLFEVKVRVKMVLVQYEQESRRP